MATSRRAGGQTYNSAVTVGGNDTLTTTNSAVDFAGTLDGTSSGAQSLTVNSGTAATTFGGKIGGNDPLDNLTVTADSLSMGNKLYGTGLLTIQPYTASTALNINDGTSSGLYLTGTEQGYIQNDWAGIAIGSASGTGTIKVGANTWNSPVTFNDGSGTIEFSGAQTLGANTLTADSASGAIQITRQRCGDYLNGRFGQFHCPGSGQQLREQFRRWNVNAQSRLRHGPVDCLLNAIRFRYGRSKCLKSGSDHLRPHLRQRTAGQRSGRR